MMGLENRGHVETVRPQLTTGIPVLAITRRHLLQSGAVAAMAPALGTFPLIETASAQSAAEPAWRHALSLFGDVKYPADFKRFDYVNPDAPKRSEERRVGKECRARG